MFLRRFFAATPPSQTINRLAGSRSLKMVQMKMSVSNEALASPGPYRPVYDPSKPMYKFQHQLPMLPVPTLEETCEKYLQTVRPLLPKEDEWQHTQTSVQEFLQSDQSKQLQQRLLQRRDQMAVTGKSWFIDWWNDYAYMSYRDPVVLNVSYFFHYRDDRRRSKQTRRAANLIAGALEFRDAVVKQELAPDMAGSGEKAYPLCMHQYQYMFNSCRVPTKPSDVTLTYDPSKHGHVAVARKGKFYRLDVVDAQGKALSEAEIEAKLDAIKLAADAHGFAPLPFGSLTSENRDTWTDAREKLVSYSERNRASLEAIQSAILMICLDDYAPTTRDEVGRALWHGDGKNRWYDKTMQFMVFENGKAGFLGEHAMMDATPLFRMSEFLCKRYSHQVTLDVSPNTYFRADANPPKNTSDSPAPASSVVQLGFDCPESFSSYLHSAIARFEADIARHDHKVLAFEGFGKNTIKKLGCSPDSFAQMVIQLAFYKLFGEPRATYESSQTKKYAWGRTEVCRSLSSESLQWVQAMMSPEISNVKKAQLARNALAAHGKYISGAANGRGVDRHLLGLKMSLKPGEPVPSIFTDPAFKLSSHWSISTSQVSSEHFDGWGWGEVVPDGFGIAYMIKSNAIHYNVAALKGGPGYEAGPGSWRGKGKGIENGCQRLVHYLQESVVELGALLEEEVKSKPAVKSKL